MITDGLHAPRAALSLGALSACAAIIGLATGVVATAFRLCLEGAGEFRNWVLATLATWGPGAVIVPVVAVALITGGVAAAVARFEPSGEGSGIPRVEAVVRGDAHPSRRRLLPIKFLGGVFVIGAGLALGREGPSVHMGGNIGHTLGRYLRRNKDDIRLLIAAGAAAGLSSAFSAPFAGAVFVLEELVKRFEARMSVAVLTASSCAYLVVHLWIGPAVIFPLPPLPALSLDLAPAVALVGLACGLAGVLFNKALLSTLCWAENLHLNNRRVPVFWRGATIGALVGALGFYFPFLVGGGDNLTLAALRGEGLPGLDLSALGHGGGLALILASIALVCLARFALAVACYAAGTPGGIFAPMLVLGTQIGAMAGFIAAWLGLSEASPQILAAVGMAAFFAASTRAPVTGLVLATEMTGAIALAPAMLGACAVATFVAEATGNQPIYEALANRSQIATTRNYLLHLRLLRKKQAEEGQ